MTTTDDLHDVIIVNGEQPEPEPVLDLTGLEAAEAVHVPVTPVPENEPLLLDVRTQEEYAQVHLPGSRLIPVTELQARAHEVIDLTGNDPNKFIGVYCKRGIRAQRAVDYLKALGFTNVHNLGGIEEAVR